MRLAVALAVAVALAQPALALSCMAPDIARDYASAAQSDDRYIIVKGDLFLDETALPDRVGQSQTSRHDSRDIAGWLAGHSLTRDGFAKPFERDVILRVSCVGPWCGGTVKGEHLAFLKQEDQHWVMQIAPCPGMTYADPTQELEETVLGCIRGETCTRD